jgi:hypothetical protein
MRRLLTIGSLGLLILIFLNMQGCSKDPHENPNEVSDSLTFDPQGVLIAQKPLWQLAITDGDINEGFAGAHVVYKNGTVIFTQQQQNNYMTFLDCNLPGFTWKLQKPVGSHDPKGLDFAYQHDKYMVYLDNGINNIDLEEGKFYWINKTQKGADNPQITGIDSLFFVSLDFHDDYFNQACYYGNIKTGEITIFLHPTINDTAHDGDTVFIAGIHPVKKDNELFLLIFYGSYKVYYTGLYNFSKKEWVYEKKTRPWINISTAIIVDDKFYSAATEDIFCGNIFSGDIIWSKHYSPYLDMTFEPAISEGHLIAVQTNQTIFALDLKTGEEKWRTPSNTTTHALKELNGIVYYTGGWYNLNAVDVKTGKMLWKLLPPDDSRFREVKIIPGESGKKGRIIGTTRFNVYCYEAIQ